jgi:hypothetical protein
VILAAMLGVGNVLPDEGISPCNPSHYSLNGRYKVL